MCTVAIVLLKQHGMYEAFLQMRRDKLSLLMAHWHVSEKTGLGVEGAKGQPRFGQFLHLLPSCLGGKLWPPPKEEPTDGFLTGTHSSTVPFSTWFLQPAFISSQKLRRFLKEIIGQAAPSRVVCSPLGKSQKQLRISDGLCAFTYVGTWDTTNILVSHLSLLEKAHLKQE